MDLEQFIDGRNREGGVVMILILSSKDEAYVEKNIPRMFAYIQIINIL
jgi:hypothetical protein